jgi:hypothetical protein
VTDDWRSKAAADIFRVHNVKYLPPTCTDTAVLFCYFNPTNSLKLLENFNAVKRKLDNAQIPNYAIELCIGEQQAQTRADFVVYSPTALFYKEILWNRLATLVPAQYTKLVFIDADVLFLTPDWVDQCSAVLNTADVMQPMRSTRWLGGGYSASYASKLCAESRTFEYGHPGFAAGVRRTWLEKIGFPAAVMGSGDGILWDAIAYSLKKISASAVKSYPDFHARVAEKATPDYFELCAATPPKCGVLSEVDAIHLPHGSLATRGYSARHNNFTRDDFSNLLHTDDGIPHWPADSRPADLAAEYFSRRREDGPAHIVDRVQTALQFVDSSQIPVYCINLPRARDRRERMQREWDDQRGVPLNFFTAVDKHDICRHEAATRDGGVLPYSAAEATRLVGRKLRCGERACRLSHFLCAQKLLRRYPDAPLYVILEDDVRPMFYSAAEFFRRIICGFYEQYGVDILVGQGAILPFEAAVNLRLFGFHFKFNPKKAAWLGTQCLIFSRAGLEKYCVNLHRSCPTDAWHFYGSETRVCGLINNVAEHIGDTTYLENGGGTRTMLD